MIGEGDGVKWIPRATTQLEFPRPHRSMMSDSRMLWSKHEKELLWEVKSQHPKAELPELTTLFNLRNYQIRTKNALRNQLKAARRLERQNGAEIANFHFLPKAHFNYRSK